MKNLVVYYSRTGNTKLLAEKICENLDGCDTEEIKDIKERKGIFGYLRSGREAMKHIPGDIEKTEKNPNDYDLVIIGTPVWGWTLASPVRTYLSINKFKRVAFFCTEGGSGADKTFKEMQNIIKKEPVAILEIKVSQIKDGTYVSKVKDFVDEL